jgi:hypothetical protein
MRKYQIAFVAALAVLATAQAQDCNQFLMLQKDKTVEVSIYDKKGQPSGKQVYTVKDVSSSGGTVTGTINTEQFDKNSNSKAKATSTIQCSGGEFPWTYPTIAAPAVPVRRLPVLPALPDSNNH